MNIRVRPAIEGDPVDYGYLVVMNRAEWRKIAEALEEQPHDYISENLVNYPIEKYKEPLTMHMDAFMVAEVFTAAYDIDEKSSE